MLARTQYCEFELTDFLNLSATGNETTQVYSRFDQGGIVTGVRGVNTPTLYARCARLFEEYAVKGFSLEWSPNNIIPTDISGQSGNQPKNVLGVAYVYQDINSFNIANYQLGSA